MRDSQRVVVNTTAQYTRTLITTILSLYITRVVLSALGQSDYGIYTLIAGVVAMLGFITNSLVQSTQRFISFYQGKGDKTKLKEVFNNSLIIHIVLGLIIAILLELASPFLFDGFLNIPSERLHAATIVYQIVVIILFVTFVTSPYTALLISHENIVYISIIEVADALLKVLLVVIMAHSNADKLIFYSVIMLGFQVFKLFAMSAYCHIRYEECCFPNLKNISLSYIKEMMSFAGWKVYGTACMVGRDQGSSIVLNQFFGTIINAGWGIGFHISSYTNTLSTAITNALAPQIVKAEGRGDRQHSIWLSYILSKLVFFMMSIIGIPMMFEITAILILWLGNPPETASTFAIMFIFALLIDSMTIGLTHINNAIGNIGKYIFIITTPKIFTVAIAWCVIKLGLPVVCVCVVYVFIEGICSLVRVPLIRQQAGISISLFYREVILREILPALFCVVICYFCTHFLTFKYRFVITFLLAALIYTPSFYYLGLSKRERGIVNGLLYGFCQKIKNIIK